MARFPRKKVVAADPEKDGHAASASPKNARAKVFASIAARSDGFQPARQVLRKVRAVPTIYPDFDRVSRVAGWPVDRVTMVHGPSHHGKTYFVAGVGLSFLKQGHMFCLVDAEMSTPIPWVETMYGAYADSERFFASRPSCYEQAVDDIKSVAEGVADAREKGRIPKETVCLFGVDSMRALVPKKLIEKIDQLGADGDKGSIDGMNGAAGRYRALLNAAWADSLVPLMYHTGNAILLVGREADDMMADARDKQFGNDWKLTGGKATFFASSLVVRIVRDGYVYEDVDGTKRVVGERHRAELHKTKVAAHQDRTDRAIFHTSNGLGSVPEGFDFARDVLHVGEMTNVIQRAKRTDGKVGSGLAFKNKRWRGEAQFVKLADRKTLEAIEAAARAKFTEDDGVVSRADSVGAAT